MCGDSHNAAIDHLGHLFTWGDCTSGCLGHSDFQTKDLFQPKKVVDLCHLKVIDVGCGKRFTVAIAIKKETAYISDSMR